MLTLVLVGWFDLGWILTCQPVANVANRPLVADCSSTTQKAMIRGQKLAKRKTETEEF